MYGECSYGSCYYGGISVTVFVGYVLTLNESISMSESISVKIIAKVLGETLILTDSLSKAILRTYSDTINTISTMLKQTQKSLFETFNISEIFSKMLTTYRTFTDSIITTDSILKMTNKALSDTTIAVDTFIKTVGKSITDTAIRVTDTIRRYLNGLIINPWTKVVKTIASFTKIVKPTATYTKVNKPDDDIWTKTDKPY